MSSGAYLSLDDIYYHRIMVRVTLLDCRDVTGVDFRESLSAEPPPAAAFRHVAVSGSASAPPIFELRTSYWPRGDEHQVLLRFAIRRHILATFCKSTLLAFSYFHASIRGRHADDDFFVILISAF